MATPTITIILGILTLFILGIASLHSIFLLVTVQHNSMLPTLKEGDRVLVLRHWPHILLKRGQIALIRPPIKKTDPYANQYIPYVKRIAGLPNETVVLGPAELGELHLKLFRAELNGFEGNKTWTIPAAHIFVKGDSPYSTDSRDWGPIPIANLVGIVIAVFRSE